MLSTGKLWIIATPIGNVGDFSPRACEVLSSAYMVLAEDTRRASRFLRDMGIPHGPVLSLYDHNEQSRIGQALDLLASGKSLAVVSDAGTPLISDPGYRLVRACRERGFEVSAIPGASAPIVALSAAGIAPLPFTFLGFLPRGNGDREVMLRRFGATPAALVFFERKDRLAQTLAIAFEVLGDRELAICRELTKVHEEYIIGRLADGAMLARDLLGEITVIIGAPEATSRTDEGTVLAHLQTLIGQGLGLKEACRELAKANVGYSAKDLYMMMLKSRND